MASINDLGIDIGTANVLISMKDRGIVLAEPAVVAVNRDTHSIVAYGEDARRMMGRTPGNILAIRPLMDGTMSDSELTGAMLSHFVEKVTGRRNIFSHPRVVMTVPTRVNEADCRALSATLFDCGMRRTQLLRKTMAAAIGAGIGVESTYGSMVVDISAGVTDVAVISSGKIVVEECSPVCGDMFSTAITRYLRQKENLLIGEQTAELVKINLGAAIPRAGSLYMDVSGRNLIAGLPKTVRVTSEDVYEALEETVQMLIETIHGVLERSPAELAADIFENGITLTGGGALLFGLSDAVSAGLKLPVFVAEDPQSTAVNGCAITLENIGEMSRFLEDNRRHLLSI